MEISPNVIKMDDGSTLDLSKCNTLEMDYDTLPEEMTGSGSMHARFTKYVQELPIGVGEILKLSIVSKVNGGFRKSWYVYRIEADTYRFINEYVNKGVAYSIGESPELSKWSVIEPVPELPFHELDILAKHIIVFFETVEKQERYPFVIDTSEAIKRTSSKTIKKSLLCKDRTIVYLGKPPIKIRRKSNKSEGSPKSFGYARRPHRRTLRHERFRNHPKYGIYKGVHVSESWCGPKEFITKSRIYRLWQPSGIDSI
ncbi:MAG: hypothetical protein CL582_10650 [Alteromonadaceae bacterium]|nr:hypothetical protein [Alteromonadaceae bacterium]